MNLEIIRSVGALLIGLAATDARAGLTIVTTEYSQSQEAATDVTGAGNLSQVFRAVADYFTLSEIADGSAARANDVDGDGCSNEVEYFYGGNPRDDSDLPLMELSVIEHAGNTYPVLDYSRRIAAGITYTVQVSDDLEEWDDASASMIVESPPEDNGDGSEAVTLRYPVDTATALLLFFRVCCATRK